MNQEKPHFLTSLPAILTGLAALVTAAAGGYGLLANSRQGAAPTNAVAPPSASPSAAPRPASTGPAETPFSRTAQVNDPEGFVNVRAGKSTRSRIMTEVRRPKTMRTHSQDGDWWVVRTEDGTQGYVHATRIKFVEG